MSDTILRVDDIQKYYGNKGSLTKAVDHISFTVDRGEFLGIMGPSGSGKTTLLNCISTIDTVTSGHIYVENQDITELHGGKLSEFRGKKLGFIFQDFNLLDTLTAYENISLALSIAGVKTVEIQKRVKKIGEALNISDVLSKYPYQMSGGQQQRIAAARAMVTNPAIVLADEPTGALDSNSSRMLLTMLTELNQSLSATILIVTHDAFSASYCSRILFIKDGKIFHELVRGNDSRKEFFSKILEVVSVLGGALDSNSSRMLLTMLTELNQSLSATILIVTHDAFSASYCSRILFIKDGKIFHELVRGNDSRKEFFSKILEVVSVLGGEQNDIL